MLRDEINRNDDGKIPARRGREWVPPASHGYGPIGFRRSRAASRDVTPFRAVLRCTNDAAEINILIQTVRTVMHTPHNVRAIENKGNSIFHNTHYAQLLRLMSS